MTLRTIVLLACLWPLASAAGAAEPPPMMLASTYEAGIDVSDYRVSEKLDGVRGRWDGRALWTRGGHRIDAPAWFTTGWPVEPMDGELWIGRGRFGEVSGIVRAGRADDAAWRQVCFMVFDLPDRGGTFDERVLRMRTLLADTGIPWLRSVAQARLDDAAQLEARLRVVVAGGGEGLMLHRRDARYRVGRSDDLLKLKPFDDAEARVIGYTAGKGKYAGMVGALVVERADGVRFRLGSGLSDVQRAAPPPIGSHVTYRYNGLTANGVPRFARFLRQRHEMPPPDPE
ncbi:DNA ligase [Luteimonas suaedae]|uniref:DNA ligase n=1 Tax=Luteimonas suaedae TaxID=2605430 RepID=UPI0011EEDB67|nr:DNA ligase [Luteimonas suaedae]